jgi:hypothetical protein
MPPAQTDGRFRESWQPYVSAKTVASDSIFEELAVSARRGPGIGVSQSSEAPADAAV